MERTQQSAQPGEDRDPAEGDVLDGAHTPTEAASGGEALSSTGHADERGRPPSTRSPATPPPPDSLAEAGLPEEFVSGLLVKALHHRGAAGGFDLSDMLALPFALLDDVLQQLQERRFIEVHATRGPRRGEYVFKLTGAGRKRAAEELELCRYVGPAPVPFEDFCRWVELQTIEQARISEPELRSALEDVVLPESMLDLLGPAINSGRSLFLYGESGNGKTLLAERIAGVFGERYFVPYSVRVGSSVMIVHDPVHHGLPDDSHGLPDDSHGLPDDSHGLPDDAQGISEHSPPTPGGDSGDMLRQIVRSIPEHDRRYAEARRPVVVTGGELTLEQLDLQWDPTGRMYQAPPQLKAAGGVLVVDDLGRQRVPVRDLLNRWVVPLERRQDHLSLRSGRKIVVPFDCFVIFSTNLAPRALADEAFLRRIHYKIEVPVPGREEFERIFRTCCDERGIPFEEDALDYLFDEFYGKGEIEPRGCHPRDVLDHLQDLAEYRDEPARLSPSLLEPACRSYFLSSG